jgi:DNA-binding MarR family transcriptional regulator
MSQRRRLSIEVTASEKAAVKQAAAEWRMSASQYGHQKIFGAPGGSLTPRQIMLAQSAIGQAYSCGRRIEAVMAQLAAGSDPDAIAQIQAELNALMQLMQQAHQRLMPPSTHVG